MSSRLKLAGICFVAAFALAACGGGGGSPTAMDDDPPPVVDTGPSVADLFAAASDAETKAKAAGKSATDALANAKKASEALTAIATGGESAMAQANAQMILDAQSTVAQAVMDAEAAKTAAEKAGEDADNLPADTPNLAQLKADIAAALKAAEDNLEIATDIRDDDYAGSLADYALMVTGADGKGTPAKIGQDVAKAIGAALGPTSDTDGSGTRHVNTATAIPTAAVAAASDTTSTPVRMHDAPARARTWKEITGASQKMRIAAGAPTDRETHEVYVASLAGMSTSVLDNDTDPTTVSTLDFGATASGASGEETGSVYWRGILGTLICGGADCKVENGRLTGSWYFTATNMTTRYTRSAGQNSYTAYTLYATYGHWLTAAANGDITVNTYAGTGHTGTPELSLTGDGADLMPTAVYTGAAAGMSMHKTFDGTTGEAGGHKSGAFTADVELTATFGATPTVAGSITNIRGDAVGSGWSVTLDSMSLASSISATGVARSSHAGQQAGQWRSAAYGDAGERPTGIYGDFNAHFSNGHVAGAYATRKE